MNISTQSKKSPIVALLLCIFLGNLGVHRFYVGKTGTGILMLLTSGGFGIWYLIDLASLISNQFKDADGNTLEVMKNPPSFKKVMIIFGVIYAALWLFIISIFATVFSTIFFMTSGLTDVAQNQLSAIRAGNMEKAYSYISIETKKSLSFEDFEKVMKEHPSFENNESAVFMSTEINNDMGTIKGYIKTKDGSLTMIEYYLIKNGDEWKINGFKLDAPANNGANRSSSENGSEFKLFEDKINKFSIKYPSDWEYEQPDRKTVAFSGRKGNPSYYTIVNIQVFSSIKNGGVYSDVHAIKEYLKKQITDTATDVKIISEGETELPLNPKNFYGDSLVITYVYQGKEQKKMEFILQSADGAAFYTWGYTSPINQYDNDLPIAKAMYESWVIK